jgi:hypothetical protein
VGFYGEAVKKKDELIESLPSEGFLKVSRSGERAMDSGQRAALIRKGNELLNQGDFATAKRIFLTTGYTAGIERIADRHYEDGDLFEALRLYWLAPSQRKKDAMVERMAAALQTMLHEEKGSE